MVSLDISKACDSVWKHRILLILQKWNLRSNKLKCINNFLENRTFEVKFRNTLSSLFTTGNGLPQGSSLSVSLFLVAILAIISIHSSKSYYTQMTVIFFAQAQTFTTQKPLCKPLSITFLNGRRKLALNFPHQNAKQFFSTEKTKFFLLQSKCKN
jgi:hypothetical protein